MTHSRTIERLTQMCSIAMLVSAVAFFVYTAHAENGVMCHTITDLSSTPERYASPVNLFSGTPETLMSVECLNEEKAFVRIGNNDPSLYIYKWGYEKVNGEWSKVRFTGNKEVGAWYVGGAHAEIRGIEEGEEGKVLAYLCQKVDGAWKCGCGDESCGKSKWNMQTFSVGAQEEKETEESSSNIPDISINLSNFNAQTEGLDEFLQDNFDLSVEDVKEAILADESDFPTLDVYKPSSHIGLPGSTIFLSGVGFSKEPENTILWNGVVGEEGVASPNGTALPITVPNMEPGKYEVKIQVNGDTSAYGAVIWIGSGLGTAPSITSITPETGKQGDTFTVRGSGFTSENNDIITTFGVFEGNTSADGSSIIFTFKPFKEAVTFYREDGSHYSHSQPVYVYVMNTSGRSNPVKFSLEL